MLLSGATVALAVVYPWLPPWCREAAALPLGLMWAAAALVHHVIGLFVGGPAPTDYTGIPAAIGGGLVLLAGLIARSVRRSATAVKAGRARESGARRLPTVPADRDETSSS